MEWVVGELLLLLSLFIIAGLYASVGHGGASGYLAVLSLTAYAAKDPAWLKQHAWSLNLLVAGLAFYAYRKGGFFEKELALKFIITSVPFAILGGYLRVDYSIYDIMLSLTLIFAAWRLYYQDSSGPNLVITKPKMHVAMIVGAIVGFISGLIGVGGGIFLSPIILLFGWSDPKTTAGISALFIWVNSAAGLFGSAISGQIVIELNVLFPFIIAVLFGGYIGSNFGSKRLSQNTIRNLLISVMIIAATRQILELVGLW